MDLYHLAGTVALEDRAGSRWQQFNVRPNGLEQADRILIAQIGPSLDTLVADGAVSGWWYMNKPPGWRIRVFDARPDAVGQTLDALSAAGAVAEWNPAIYEPETAAFGGGSAMEIVHSLFCADTAGVLASSPLGERVSRAARAFRHFAQRHVVRRWAGRRRPPVAGIGRWDADERASFMAKRAARHDPDRPG
jgi:thiopeptide-type bacteriocin biosynthesis protein